MIVLICSDFLTIHTKCNIKCPFMKRDCVPDHLLTSLVGLREYIIVLQWDDVVDGTHLNSRHIVYMYTMMIMHSKHPQQMRPLEREIVRMCPLLCHGEVIMLIVWVNHISLVPCYTCNPYVYDDIFCQYNVL